MREKQTSVAVFPFQIITDLLRPNRLGVIYLELI